MQAGKSPLRLVLFKIPPIFLRKRETKMTEQDSYLTEKEIAISKLYFAMVKDTAEQFEEYCKIAELSEENKAKTFYILKDI